MPRSIFFILKNICSFQQLRHLAALYWTYLYKEHLENFPNLHVGDVALYLCPFLYQQPQFLKQDQNNLRSHLTRVKNLFPFEWLDFLMIIFVLYQSRNERISTRIVPNKIAFIFQWAVYQVITLADNNYLRNLVLNSKKAAVLTLGLNCICSLNLISRVMKFQSSTLISKEIKMTGVD